MRLILGTAIRISVLATALALTAACGTSARQPAQGPAASTIVATIPEPAAPSDAATTAATAGQTITIGKAVWANYQDYLAKVGRIGDGYYFVTEDGQGGGSWACGNALCQGSFDGQGAAKQQCAASNPGKTCVLFAKGSRIAVNYEVAP